MIDTAELNRIIHEALDIAVNFRLPKVAPPLCPICGRNIEEDLAFHTPITHERPFPSPSFTLMRCHRGRQETS